MTLAGVGHCRPAPRAPAYDAPPEGVAGVRRLCGMALRIAASRPDPAIVTLPWSTPLEDWDEQLLVPLPRGLSRHTVRIVEHLQLFEVCDTDDPGLVP